jgi:hypothetical protein
MKHAPTGAAKSLVKMEHHALFAHRAARMGAARMARTFRGVMKHAPTGAAKSLVKMEHHALFAHRAARMARTFRGRDEARPYGSGEVAGEDGASRPVRPPSRADGEPRGWRERSEGVMKHAPTGSLMSMVKVHNRVLTVFHFCRAAVTCNASMVSASPSRKLTVGW